MNTTYIAITIGPIYDTISESKKTRAVWAASYFFSWFMKQIITEAKRLELNIMLPYSEEIYKSSYGSGLYADRAYFIKDNNTTKQIFEEIIQSIYEKIADSQKDISITYLNEYLNIHVIEKTITNDDLENSYPLAILNAELDKAELQKNFVLNIESNPIQDLFFEKTSKSFLADDAFDNAKERKFISIGEIATTPLYRQNKDVYLKALRDDFKNEDVEFIDELQKVLKSTFKPRHKYYGVLYADGDNIGKVLKKINEKDLDLKGFSKALFDFGLKTEKLLEDYGGKGIYLGGEDILAFIPIACQPVEGGNTQTVFSLIKSIDQKFEETVIAFCKSNNLTIPSMSYGLMMAYYKFPLKEAMVKAYNLMDDVAKDKSNVNSTKNAIALTLQKHSGQYMQCVVDKSKINSTKAILNIVTHYSQNLDDKSTELLTSIVQHFRDKVFTDLYMNALNSNALEHFFENTFNENIHKETDRSKFLKSVKELSISLHEEYVSNEKQVIDILYTVLRYILFINSDKE